MNRVCEIPDITKPVVQAPMTRITGPETAAAVSGAGCPGRLRGDKIVNESAWGEGV